LSADANCPVDVFNDTMRRRTVRAQLNLQIQFGKSRSRLTGTLRTSASTPLNRRGACAPQLRGAEFAGWSVVRAAHVERLPPTHNRAKKRSMRCSVSDAWPVLLAHARRAARTIALYCAALTSAASVRSGVERDGDARPRASDPDTDADRCEQQSPASPPVV